MAKPTRKTFGPFPETVGWQKLMRWLETDRNTVAALARAAKVSQPSAHAWRWRDSTPTGAVLERLCRVIGATVADWETAARARRRKAA